VTFNIFIPERGEGEVRVKGGKKLSSHLLSRRGKGGKEKQRLSLIVGKISGKGGKQGGLSFSKKEKEKGFYLFCLAEKKRRLRGEERKK